MAKNQEKKGKKNLFSTNNIIIFILLIVVLYLGYAIYQAIQIKKSVSDYYNNTVKKILIDVASETMSLTGEELKTVTIGEIYAAYQSAEQSIKDSLALKKGYTNIINTLLSEKYAASDRTIQDQIDAQINWQLNYNKGFFEKLLF